MRVLHAELKDPDEHRARADLLQRIRDFHAALAASEPHEAIERALLLVHEDLFYEPIADAHGGQIAVVTSDRAALRPLIELVLEERPKTAAYTLLGARPALSFERALSGLVLGTSLEATRARVRVGVGRGHLLHVVVELPGVEERSGPHDGAGLAAERWVEDILGQSTFEDWIGSVTAEPLVRRGLPVVGDGSAPSYPLSELSSLVERAIVGITSELPSAPLALLRDEADWVMLEASPSSALVERQGDLVMASTRVPELLKCYLEGAPFASQRFSRHGEHFAYAKYRHDDKDLGRAAERRHTIEDAAQRALHESRAGSVTGSGIGLCYGYVNLALTDVSAAVRALREALHVLPSDQAWLLFCDDAWQHEWVALRGRDAPPGLLP
jgi:hypothetical protein